MTDPRTEWRIAQLLLALDGAGHGAAPVEAAVRIAARLQVELAALFIEDADLLRSAGLPFAREVLLSTAAERRLQAAELERALRRLALQARRELASAAERAQVKWSFETLRGHRLRSALERGDETRVLVLGRSRRRHRAGPEKGEAVYLLAPAGEPGRHARELARRLVGDNGGELVVLEGPGGGEPVPPQPGVVVIRRRLQVVEPGTVAVALRDPPALALVIAAAHPMAGAAPMLEALLNSLDCPVLLVR